MNQPTDPLVSMIVLSYNQSRFARETLDSVKAQTYKSTQLIIVDDCSSDDSVAVIDRWLNENRIECTFIRHTTNQGICKSLNDALATANGKYFSMVASDDTWLPDKTAAQVEIMERQPDHVGVLYSDAYQMDEGGNLLPEMRIAAMWKMPPPQGEVLDTLLQLNFIPPMATLIRRSCYDEVGPYDEGLPWEDWDMFMRIARRYAYIYSPAPSAKYRIHTKSYSHSDRARMIRGSFKVCLKQFRMGDLTEHQKSILTVTLLDLASELYGQNDKEALEILLTLWQVTGHARAAWMYRFARLGVSYRNWLRVNSLRLALRQLRNIGTERQ
jgi:glycosyltransferase involved in cell wall biosynthesis